MPAWYNSILCIDLTSGHVTYTMVDKNKVRGIPGVFGGAVSIGRNILCPQTYKTRIQEKYPGAVLQIRKGKSLRLQFVVILWYFSMPEQDAS